MPTDWGTALQVGLIGFGLVFVILGVLYFALALTGLIANRLNFAAAKKQEKQTTAPQTDKKASITG